MTAHERLAERVTDLEQLLRDVMRHQEQLARQLQKLVDATGAALAEIEARLIAVEAHTHEPDSAVPV